MSYGIITTTCLLCSCCSACSIWIRCSTTDWFPHTSRRRASPSLLCVGARPHVLACKLSIGAFHYLREVIVSIFTFLHSPQICARAVTIADLLVTSISETRDDTQVRCGAADHVALDFEVPIIKCFSGYRCPCKIHIT